jgi:hypothetical protein
MVLFVVFALVRGALADDNVRRQADAHARRGVALYDLGKYEAAILEFERAYTLVQSDALLFNLGQAHRKLDHCEQALHYYRRFLGGDPGAKRADDVRRLVPDLEAACAVKLERPDDAAAGAAVADDPAVSAATPAAASASAATVAIVVEDEHDEPEPEPVVVAKRADVLHVDASLYVGGLRGGDGDAGSLGITGAITIPRGALLTGLAVDVGSVAWDDERAPAVAIVSTVGKQWQRGRVFVDGSIGAGGLALLGLDRPGHPLADRRAGGFHVVPGVRAHATAALPIAGAIDAWAGARIGAWLATGDVAGPGVVGIEAAVGLRFRRW